MLLPGAPLVGAAYLCLHVVVAGIVAARDRTIQGVEAADLTQAIQVRFADEVRATGEVLFATAGLSGAALGIVAAALVAGRAHLQRKRASGAAVVGVIVGLHATALALAVAYRPQLYASFLYDPGGLGRLVCVTLTDTLGVWGTALVAAGVWARFLLGPLRSVRGSLHALGRAVSRHALVVSIVVGVSLAALALPSRATTTATKDPRRPNVLILAADSLRPDRLDERRASALSTFARDAVSFDRAHVTIARTFPSWVTLLTGRFPHGHGIRTMFPSRESRARDFDALPHRFQKAGYGTFVVSDYAGDVFPRIDLGFSRVDTPTFHFGQVIRQRGLESQPALLPFLDNRLGRAVLPAMLELNRAADADDVARRTLAAVDDAGGRPFFGVTFFSTTHFPYASPSPGYRRFTDRAYRGRF